jgi:chemotaxis response regulator CheB
MDSPSEAVLTEESSEVETLAAEEQPSMAEFADETDDSVKRLEAVTEQLSSALKGLASDSVESPSLIDDVVNEVEQIAQELEPDTLAWNEQDPVDEGYQEETFNLPEASSDIDISGENEPVQEFEQLSELDSTISDNDHTAHSEQQDDIVCEDSEGVGSDAFEFALLDDHLPDASEPERFEDNPPHDSNYRKEASIMSDFFGSEPQITEPSDGDLESDLDDFAADLDDFLQQKDNQPPIFDSSSPNRTDLMSSTEVVEHQSPLESLENDEGDDVSHDSGDVTVDDAPFLFDEAYQKPIGFDEEPVIDEAFELDTDEDRSFDNESSTETIAHDELILDDRLEPKLDDEPFLQDSDSALSQSKTEQPIDFDAIELELVPLEAPVDTQDEDSLGISENHSESTLEDSGNRETTAAQTTVQDVFPEELDEEWELDDDINLELDLSLPDSPAASSLAESVEQENHADDSLMDDLSLETESSDLELDDIPLPDDETVADVSLETNRLSLAGEHSIEPESSEAEFSSEHLSETEALESFSLSGSDEDDDLDALDIPLLDDAATGMQFEILENQLQTPELNLWVLGASLGGPAAVKRFLQALPSDINAAFVLAQHIDDNFLPVLCDILDTQTPFKAIIVDQLMTLEPGFVYIAPIKQKLTFTADGKVDVVSETWTPPYAPCIDDVIISAGEVYRDQCGVIIFSGMGSDGTFGLEQVTPFGVRAWAQSPDSCANSSMPDSAIEKGFIEFIGHPEYLAEQLKEQLASVASV